MGGAAGRGRRRWASEVPPDEDHRAGVVKAGDAPHERATRQAMLQLTLRDATGDDSPTRRARSTSRLEKPHSLSNQPRTFTPPSAVVWVPDGSKRQDAGLFFTSIDTVGSGSYARMPRNGPAA